MFTSETWLLLIFAILLFTFDEFANLALEYDYIAVGIATVMIARWFKRPGSGLDQYDKRLAEERKARGESNHQNP